MILEKYAKMIEWAIDIHPHCHIFESLSPNQLSSKKWLIEELSKIVDTKENQKIEIVGSWYGYPLIQYLRENLFIDKVECWDIDKEARMIANMYNEVFESKDFVSVYGKNYWEHSRDGSEATLLINTSSEHMKESFHMMSQLYRKNKFYVKDPLIVLQSNDMHHIDEHINCVDSEEELINKHKIREVLYSGSQNIVEWHDTKIEESKYKRFMVIGKL
tara:strand:- start:2322 stop:2972 length:651 start_codon:yes stop_codon:yes gene_type:complete